MPKPENNDPSIVEPRLYSGPGNDRRFPLIVDALARLRSRSCIIDGEAVACDALVPSTDADPNEALGPKL